MLSKKGVLRFGFISTAQDAPMVERLTGAAVPSQKFVAQLLCTPDSGGCHGAIDHVPIDQNDYRYG
jgi:hypothetical protein